MASSSETKIVKKPLPGKRKKRRRVSKHIADSNKQQAQQQEHPADKNTAGDNRPNKKNKSADAKTKGLEYLQQWKDSRDDWKFNKKIQTWILRNMYDASQLPKHSFEILVEYILPNESLRVRLKTEATERAVAYQKQEEEGKKEDDSTTEHEKRKEYKRALKILKALNQEE